MREAYLHCTRFSNHACDFWAWAVEDGDGDWYAHVVWGRLPTSYDPDDVICSYLYGTGSGPVDKYTIVEQNEVPDELIAKHMEWALCQNS